MAKLAHTSASSTNWNVGNQIIKQQFVPITAMGKTLVKINKIVPNSLKYIRYD